MEKGLFIVFEGGEGAGKTSLIQNVKELFEAYGREVVVIREPGGTEYAEKLRQVYFETEGLSGESAALLMNAGRVDNIEKIINPALADGKVVIADRFSGSSLVYQGLRKGEYDEVSRITKHIPMVSIFVDVHPEVGLQRIADNNRETNRLDLMPLEQHQKIYFGFKQLSVLRPDIYWDVELDGHQTQDELRTIMQDLYIPNINAWLDMGMETEEIKHALRELNALVFA